MEEDGGCTDNNPIVCTSPLGIIFIIPHHSQKSEYDTGATLTQQPSDSTITRPHDFYFSTFIEGEYNQK